MTVYAYQPLEDSFFGSLVGEPLLDQGISKKEILDSIYSNFAGSQSGVQIVGTPKAEKLIVMNILPDRF